MGPHKAMWTRLVIFADLPLPGSHQVISSFPSFILFNRFGASRYEAWLFGNLGVVCVALACGFERVMMVDSMVLYESLVYGF